MIKQKKHYMGREEEELNDRPDAVLTETDVEDEDQFPGDGDEVVSVESLNDFFRKYGFEDDGEISSIDVNINIETEEGTGDDISEGTDGSDEEPAEEVASTESKKNKKPVKKVDDDEEGTEEDEEMEEGAESYKFLFSLEDEEFNDETTDGGGEEPVAEETNDSDADDDGDIEVDINVNVNVDDGDAGGGDEEPAEAGDDAGGGEEPSS